MRSYLLLLCVLTMGLLSCNEDMDKTTIAIDGHIFEVEIANDNQERKQGLMHRDHMDRGTGMLFVFPNSQPRSFWMKDTHIPLSIAYMDERGIIIDIKNMQPLDTSPVPSSAPAKYALELNQGEFRYLGIRVGSQMEFLAEEPTAKE